MTETETGREGANLPEPDEPGSDDRLLLGLLLLLAGRRLAEAADESG